MGINYPNNKVINMVETIHKQGRVKILSKCGKNVFNTLQGLCLATRWEAVTCKKCLKLRGKR